MSQSTSKACVTRLPPVAEAFLQAREIWAENKRTICDLNSEHNAELCSKCGPNEAQKLVQTWLEDCGVLEREIVTTTTEPDEYQASLVQEMTTQDLPSKQHRVKKVVRWLRDSHLKRRHTTDQVEENSRTSSESLTSRSLEDLRSSRFRFQCDSTLKCPPPAARRCRDTSPPRSRGTRDFTLFASLSSKTLHSLRPTTPKAMESIEELDFRYVQHKCPNLYKTRGLPLSTPAPVRPCTWPSPPITASKFSSKRDGSEDVHDFMHQLNIKRGRKDDWLLFILYYWVTFTIGLICVSPFFMLTMGLKWYFVDLV